MLIIVAAHALTCSLSFKVSLLVKSDECRKGWMLIIVAFAPDARGCLRRGNWKSRAPRHSLPTPACAFSNKITHRRKSFVNVTEIQFQRRKKSNYFAARTKTSTQTKATTNALPMVNAVASISNIKYVNWAAIQNMINGFEAGV